MSPTQFHHDDDQKPLNINIHSNFSHGITNKTQQPPPPPVIIYTHSPKVIHTRPCDFKALVQKLTGYTPQPAQDQDLDNVEDNESSSVVTEEHGSPHVDSCVVDGGGVGVGVVVPPPPYNVARFDPYFIPTPHRFTFYAPDTMLLNRNVLYSDI